jgi:hypothetical protein
MKAIKLLVALALLSLCIGMGNAIVIDSGGNHIHNDPGKSVFFGDWKSYTSLGGTPYTFREAYGPGWSTGDVSNYFEVYCQGGTSCAQGFHYSVYHNGAAYIWMNNWPILNGLYMNQLFDKTAAPSAPTHLPANPGPGTSGEVRNHP